MDMIEYRPRNPETHARHKRELWLQIVLPIAGFALLLVIVGALAAWGLTPAQASLWGDISLIWLILPSMTFALLGMLVFGGLAYATIKLIGFLPYQFYRLHNLLLLIDQHVRTISDKIVEPVLRMHTFNAKVSALRQRVRR